MDHISLEFRNILNTNNKNLVEIVNAAYINKSNISAANITIDDITTPDLLPIEIASLESINFTTNGPTPLFLNDTTPVRINNYTNAKISEDYDVSYNDLSNYGLYIDRSINPFNSAKLKLNNMVRFQKQGSKYFNYVQPYQHFLSTPKDGVNCYSFALKPIDYQPSGVCNFSKFQNIDLEFEFNKNLDKNVNNSYIHYYATNYNLLKINNGKGNLIFL